MADWQPRQQPEKNLIPIQNIRKDEQPVAVE